MDGRTRWAGWVRRLASIRMRSAQTFEAERSLDQSCSLCGSVPGMPLRSIRLTPHTIHKQVKPVTSRVFNSARFPGCDGDFGHHRTVPTESQEADGKDAASKPAQGISHFLAKVFDQLSLSSWLPAVSLVGALATLISMHAKPHTLDPVTAIERLLALRWGGLLLILFGVVISAIATQAFGFGAVRLLEGYWPNVPPFRWVRAVLLRIRRRTRLRIKRRIQKLRLRAFESVKTELLAAEPAPAVAILDHAIRHPDEEDPVRRRRKYEGIAGQIDWMARVDSVQTSRLERYYNLERELPAPHRLLPTRLGNVLRSYEDQLSQSGQELERFVMRAYDAVPSRLMVQHDQFSNRLDLYCTMVPTCVMLALTSAFLVPKADGSHPWLPKLVSIAIFLALATANYEAAISSARGYGTVLVAMRSYMDRAQAPQDENTAPRQRTGMVRSLLLRLRGA